MAWSGDVYSRHSGVNGSPNNAVNPLSLLADVAIDSDNNSIDGKKLSRVKEALQERLQNTGESFRIVHMVRNDQNSYGRS